MLYELLTRQVASDALSSKESSPSVDLIKKYFNPNTELGKELNLYSSFFAATNLSEVKASKYIDIIIEKRKKLNNPEIAKLKFNLIKEMREIYNIESMLSTKIPSYKMYASVYKIFLYETNNKKQEYFDDVTDLMTSRFTLMEQLMSSTKPTLNNKVESDALVEYKKQDEDLRLYIFKILIEKFNKKYSGLDGKQKVLLRHFINDMAGVNQLREHINSEIPALKEDLLKKLSDVTDKVLKIKLEEVINQLDKISTIKQIGDNHVTAMLIAYEINKELEK